MKSRGNRVWLELSGGDFYENYACQSHARSDMELLLKVIWKIVICNIFLGIYVLSKDLRICQRLVHLKHSENEE